MHDRLKTTGRHPTGNLSEPKHRTRSVCGPPAGASHARALNTRDGALTGGGQTRLAPLWTPTPLSRSRSSLCGQDMCSAGQVAGRRGRRKRHAGEEARRPAAEPTSL